MNRVKTNYFLKNAIVIYAVITSLIISLIKINNTYFSVIIVVALTIIFMTFAFKTNDIVIDIISLTIGYSTYFVTSLVVCFGVSILPKTIRYEVGVVLSIMIQLVMVNRLLKIKRIVNGINVIKHKDNVIVFGIMCFCILGLSAVFDSNKEELILMVAFIILFMLSVLSYTFWQKAVVKQYIERLSIRNIDSLNAELDEKNDYIRRLTEDKDRLEKINHRNYKLVPAMQGAVMHYLNGVSSFIEQYADNPAFTELALTYEEGEAENKLKEFITEGNRLMEELNRMNSEWTELVGSENVACERNAPSCGITRVDYILSYMYERATREDFLIKADIDNGFNKITEKIITEEELATLIADLIENAIIANRHNGGKDILVRMGIMNKEYVVEVYDCGIAFDKEVLLKYGLEKITTHSDENGSGIGMMQTHEILNKCGASIYIDELSDDSGLFTKRITVVFNRKNQYVLYTNRSEEEVAYLNKRSDLMVIKR